MKLPLAAHMDVLKKKQKKDNRQGFIFNEAPPPSGYLRYCSQNKTTQV